VKFEVTVVEAQTTRLLFEQSGSTNWNAGITFNTFLKRAGGIDGYFRYGDEVEV
jgi:hypothetical protein